MWAFWLALVGMIIGIVGILLPIVPGVGFVWLVILIYALAEGFATIDPWIMVVLTLLGAAGVTSDLWVSQVGGKVGGASWKSLVVGAVFGVIGFVIGLVLGGVGAIPMGMIGMLLGILVAEYVYQKDWRKAARAGTGWLVGCLFSTVIQLIIALAMILLFVQQVLKG